MQQNANGFTYTRTPVLSDLTLEYIFTNSISLSSKLIITLCNQKKSPSLLSLNKTGSW